MKNKENDEINVIDTATKKAYESVARIAVDANLSISNYFLLVSNIYCMGILQSSLSAASGFSDHKEMIEAIKKESSEFLTACFNKQDESIKSMFESKKGDN